MKKTFIILMAVALATLWAMPALAGLTNTAHDDQTVSGGPCAACHLPHGAVSGGDRLWPADPISASATANNVRGVIAGLCSYCHADWGGATYTYPDAASNDYVYGGNSHGYWMSAATAAIPNSYSASGLDYHADANDGVIECTTCHNVHDDPTGTGGTGYRPFLEADLNEICSGCHSARRFEAGADVSGSGAIDGTNPFAAWGGAAFVGTGNPGSHPVGTDITGDVFGGASPITIPFEMAVPYDNVTTGWDMGGHLHNGLGPAGGGGVTCVTCHAVHGVQNDTLGANQAANMTDTTPQPNMLAYYQGTAGDAVGPGRSIANGNDDYNALCEACHVGTAPNATDYPSAVGGFNPNPGGTEWGHPVDDMDATTTWTAGFPVGWPTGSTTVITAGANVDPIPICESCHVAHPLANAGNRSDETSSGDFTNSEYILRNTSAAVCSGCHGATTAANAEHHPIGITYDRTGIDTQLPADGGVLGCGTCHGGGATGGAHNWGALAQIDMAPGWLPADNARGSTYDANMSITCMNCHYAADGDATTKSPTLHDGLLYNAANEAKFFTLGSGNGTHFIGLITDTWANYGAGGSLGAFNPETDAWTAARGGVGGYSRFGGSAGAGNAVLVCESCHELQPAGNVDNMHLLLATFIEEQQAQADTRSDFCEGCHLPTGTHPQTGDNVTRSGATLTTSLSQPWLSAPADTNVVLDGGTNIINCDNCHQVHDAADNSYTFILDTVNSNLGAPATTTTGTWESGNYDNTYVVPVQNSKGGDHNQFCAECHPYN